MLVDHSCPRVPAGAIPERNLDTEDQDQTFLSVGSAMRVLRNLVISDAVIHSLSSKLSFFFVSRSASFLLDSLSSLFPLSLCCP